MRRSLPGSWLHRRRADGAVGADHGERLHGGLPASTDVVDLERRRDQLTARLAELQWDLGGLVYEMATRNRIRTEVLVRRAAALQNVDAELAEVERILRLEQTSTAGECPACGAPHSTGAAFCWQCGHTLLQELQPAQIAPLP